MIVAGKNTESDIQYFASIQDWEPLLRKLEALVGSYYAAIEETGFAGLWKLVYKTYQSGQNSKGQLQRLENEEHQTSLLKLRINDFGNIITHLHNLITKDAPKVDAVPVNSDSETLDDAEPAKQVLEFYQNKKFLNKTIRDVKLYELLFGEGYLVVDWDKEAGLTVAEEAPEEEPEEAPEGTKKSKEKTPRYIRQGDLVFKAKSPFNVIRDVYQEPQGMKWHIIRDIVNFELLAGDYKLTRDDHQRLCSDYTGINFDGSNSGEFVSNKIDIYTLYHSPIAEYPEGRRVTFIKGKILEDATLSGAKIIRSAHQNIENTSLGNTVAFDLIEIETAKNNIASAIINNNARFGLNAIVSAKGSKVDVQKLLNGVTMIEYEPGSPEDVPKTLTLNKSNSELYTAMDKLVEALQRNSGINEVIRGHASPNQSGQALALISSMAIQLAFGYQQSFRETYKMAGEALLAVMKKNLSGSRKIAIIGQNGISSTNIAADSFADEYEVTVELVSPLKSTVQGRSQVADKLFEAGSVTPNQYVDFLNTGRLEAINEEHTSLIEALRKEKEALLKGEEPRIVSLQNHLAFIKSAQALLNNQDLSAEKIDFIQQLILARMEKWKEDSQESLALLTALGIPLHPEAMPAPEAPPEAPPPAEAPGEEQQLAPGGPAPASPVAQAEQEELQEQNIAGVPLPKSPLDGQQPQIIPEGQG